MTAISVTAAQVAVVYPQQAEIHNGIALAALTKGLAAYRDPTTGKIGIADANDSGKEQFRGLVLEAAGAGQGFSLLKRGIVYGFDLSGLNYDDPVYLSDTAGALDTAAGTLSVLCGRVVAITDHGTFTKALYIEADWLRIWA